MPATNNISQLVISILKKRRWLLVKLLLIEIAAAAVSVILPFFGKLQIDFLSREAAPSLGLTQSLWLVFIGLLVAPFLIEVIRHLLVERLRIKLASQYELKLRYDVETKIWDKMKRFDLGFFQSKRNMHLIKTATESSYVLGGLVNFVRNNLFSLMTLVGIVPLLFSLDLKLLLLILAAGLLQVLISELRTSLRLGQQFVANLIQDQAWAIRDVMQTKFGSIKEIGGADSVISSYLQANEREEQLATQQQLTNLKADFLNWLINNIVLILANLLVARQILLGNLSLGVFTLTVSYVSQVNQAISSITGIKSRVEHIRLDLSKLKFILNLKSRLKLTDRNLDLKDGELLELDKVSFAYPGFYEDEKQYLEQIVSKIVNLKSKRTHWRIEQEIRDWKKLIESGSSGKKVLHNVSLCIKKGQFAALLGRNGSGKTTITRLLLHSYEPDLGQVKLDGINVHEYDPEQYQYLCSYLHQTPFLISRFTLKDNLLLGVLDQHSDEEIYEVLDQLSIGDLIRNLPKGLDSVLEEDTSFSGGEKQLLAIARILLQQRPFIIFDEGSSQLDIEREKEVLRIVKKKRGDAGILFISHRITVAKNADSIYVIDDGSIVQEGTHNELIRREGLYKKFWELQVVA